MRKILHSAFFIVALTAFATLATGPTGANAQTLPDFKSLAKNCGPAVVNISTERQVERPRMPNFFRNMPQGTPFDDFFQEFGDPFGGMGGMDRGTPQMRKEKSLGSGFIISNDGYIVTNNHVVENATTITVNIQNGNKKGLSIPATIIGTDKETDVALLKVKETNLPFLEFGNSDAIEVGDWVIAIGNPFGLDHSVTKGIISAKGRDIQSGPFDNFLQTDASINPGNSGGPLIDMSGKVIGINAAIVASGQGIGFAIPSNMAKATLDQLKSGKKIKRGWLGVQIQPVDDTTAKALGLSEAKGTLVADVIAGEPAEKAGIKPGDIILKIGNEEITDSSDLLRKVAMLEPGSPTEVAIFRDGKEQKLSLTLGTRKATETAANDTGGEDKTQSTAEAALGINVRALTTKERNNLNLPTGPESMGILITSVSQGKPADDAGLRSGDILLTANLLPLKKVADLRKIATDASKKGAIIFKVMRGDKTFFLSMPIKQEEKN